MSTYLATFAIMFIAFLGLAVGVLFGREPIKGSCGGIGGRCGGCSRACSRKRSEEG